MASEAEVDLIINTSDTLPELERDLAELIQSAEASADELEIQAVLDRRESLATLISEVTDAVDNISASAPEIQLEAALDVVRSLQELQDDLDLVIESAQADAEAIELDAQLDADLAQLDAEIDALVQGLEERAPEVDIEVDVDRDREGSEGLARLLSGFTSILGPLARAGGGIAAAGLAASTAAPLLAGVAGAVQAIAPASALAVSGLLTLQLASNTVKIAMIGMGDAITAALDPEAKPEDLAKALERLAPSAQAFVLQLRSMRKDLTQIQQNVQQNFFQGFDQSLRELSTAVLPLLSSALARSATELNVMARGAASAATDLARNGTLGRALEGSITGLNNLSAVPGQIVTGLGQIAAAAAPAFGRVTEAAAAAAGRISTKLSAAFESGALENAINGAIDAIAQLGRIAGNIFGGLGNIIGTVSGQGEGLFSVLEKVSQAFEDVTASQGFQQALRALTQTLGVVVDTILPVLSNALQALGPVFTALAAPVQLLVRALGEGLNKIITALGPVLVSLANALGQVVIFLTPLIDLAARLIAAVLPALIPLFDSLGQIINTMVPFVEALVSNLAAQLLPILTTLATEVLPKLLPPFVELAQKIFPILTEILTRLGPELGKIAEAFANVLVELVPVLVELFNLQVALAEELMPILGPLLELMIKFTTGGLKFIADVLNGIVVPALRILVDFLKGDFDAAWNGARDLIDRMAKKSAEILAIFVQGVIQGFQNMGRIVAERLTQIGSDIVNKLRTAVEGAIQNIQSLPSRAAASLAGAGQALVSAGADMVRGFINGIQSQLGHLREVASSIADSVSGSVKDFLGISSPSKLMMGVGEDTMEGFRLGIADSIPDLRRELQGVASLAPSFALPNGQSLRLPQLSQQAPTVQVFIGNEQFNGHIDTRVAQSGQVRDRLIVRGVRS